MIACGLHIGAFTCQRHMKGEPGCVRLAAVRWPVLLGMWPCIMRLFGGVVCLCNVGATVLGYACSGFTEHCQYMCL